DVDAALALRGGVVALRHRGDHPCAHVVPGALVPRLRVAEAEHDERPREVSIFLGREVDLHPWCALPELCEPPANAHAGIVGETARGAQAKPEGEHPRGKKILMP